MATSRLAGARLVPIGGGPGWLARAQDAVIWSPEPLPAAGQLLASSLAKEPEQLLARLARGWAEPSARAWPTFAALVGRGDEIVLVTHGPVEVEVAPEGAPAQTFGVGEQKGSWATRTFTGTVTVRAGAAGAGGDGSGPSEDGEPSGAGTAGDLVNMKAGLVRASGFQLVPGTARPSASEGPQPPGAGGASALFDQEASRPPDEAPLALEEHRAADHPAMVAAAPAGPGPAAVPGPGQRQAGSAPSAPGGGGAGEAGPAPEPDDLTVVDVPDLGDQTLAEQASGNGGPVVVGTYCPNGHFNDPRSRACRQCGSRLAPGTAQVERPRPSLGQLTWEDGEVSPLGQGALVGREVVGDQEVFSGHLNPIVPAGTNDSMSRVHAELRSVGWDVAVTDRGSTNGTFIWDDVSKAWQRLVPGEPQLIVPGTVLAFGERTATFEA